MSLDRSSPSALTHIVSFVLLALLVVYWIPPPHGNAGAPPRLSNGDVNGDEKLDMADPVYLLSYLFLAGPPPAPIPCEAPTPALEWSDPLQAPYSYEDAVKLVEESGQGWRLPTMAELVTLVEWDNNWTEGEPEGWGYMRPSVGLDPVPETVLATFWSASPATTPGYNWVLTAHQNGPSIWPRSTSRRLDKVAVILVREVE